MECMILYINTNVTTLSRYKVQKRSLYFFFHIRDGFANQQSM